MLLSAFFVSFLSALLAEESFAFTFATMPVMLPAPKTNKHDYHRPGNLRPNFCNRITLFANPSHEEDEPNPILKLNYDGGIGDGTFGDDEIDEATLEEIRTGQPSEWMVMKQLLGVNIFTFILAGLIIFFLSMNYFLGVGWLGSSIGIPGTGTFQEVSPSLPGTIDLNKPEYRL